jgi:hypothetical protein
MLDRHRIDLIQVEAGVHPANKVHVPLQAFRDYLEPRGYFVVRFFDQEGAPLARRCNPLFVSQRLADENMTPKNRARREARRNKGWL